MISPKTKRRKKKHNKESSKSEENEDRISDLPDCLLLHILSFLNTKDAVQTCILSTRWKNLWKHLPTLTLSSSHFRSLEGFTKFVSGVFDLRDASTALHDLDFGREDFMEPHILKRIVNYAASHDVQRLRIDVACNIERIPPCIFSCQTLTSLSLSVGPRMYRRTALFPNTLNLPALTSLYLQYFAFRGGDDGRADPFSGCNRLNSLIICHCRVLDAKNLCISSTTLVNLTIHNYRIYRWCNCKIEISAPSLCRFSFTGPLQKLCSGSNLSSIKEVHIEAALARYNPAETPLVLLSWLTELSDIKSLTISPNTLQVLSLAPDLLEVKLPSLCNLKSLKVIMKPLSCDIRMILRRRNPNLLKEAAKIPDGIVDFLLQNSPLAKVDIIDW